MVMGYGRMTHGAWPTDLQTYRLTDLLTYELRTTDRSGLGFRGA